MMINKFRDFLSDLTTWVQTISMKQYGYFNSEGNYVPTKPIPTWVYRSYQKLGYLAFSLDPSPKKTIEK